jgi:hypothetical protein
MSGKIRVRIQEALSDFIIVDGLKLWRSNCKICGKEFYDKSPFRKNCKDTIEHKEVRRHIREQERWSRVGGYSGTRDMIGEGNSADNIAKIHESQNN